LKNFYLWTFVEISFHVVRKAKPYFAGGLLSQHFFFQNVWDKSFEHNIAFITFMSFVHLHRAYQKGLGKPKLGESGSLVFTVPTSWAHYTGQQISKSFCVCDEYVINFFVCIYEVRKGT